MSRYLLGDKHRRCEYCGGIEGATVRPLTAKQSRIYDYLADFIESHGYAPSFDEIADAFGFSSLASVHEHLTNIEAKGWIRRSYNLSRAIECLVPVAALVGAGAETEPATPAEAQLKDSAIASPPLEDKTE